MIHSIPDDVRRFLMEAIDSVAQLEALLLIRRHPERNWTANELAGRLYIDIRQTEGLLAALCQQGLCTADAGEPRQYRYQPGSADTAAVVDRLAEIYAKQLVPITNIIHSKAKAKVQQFADAFRFRKED
jgi:hypothetical protein